MPELPEVESIRRYLIAQEVVGRRFTRIDIGWPSSVVKPESDAEAFVDLAVGAPIDSPVRRGKYLILPLLKESTRRYLILHMGMTGSLHVRSSSDAALRLTRTTFWLDDERRIELKDPRKWAKLWCVPDADDAISHLAPDPWDVSSEIFAATFRNRRRRIKPALLDQSLIAGVGNIYADEALHRAGISPLRRCNRISESRLEELHRHIIEALEHAIDFITRNPSPDGSPYVVDAYDERMRLPRDGTSTCSKCEGEVGSRRIEGRTAYYCRTCQR